MHKKIFINGKIFTSNDKQPYAEAVAIVDNKIVFVGSNKKAKEFFDNETEIIDLQNKLMIPGLIDNHTHFIYGGFYLLGLDLRPAKSIEEFKSLLKYFIEKNKGKWIIGGNWNHESWAEKKLPDNKMIDDFTQDTPVFINRIDGHIGLANSLALKLSGITRDTQNPEGGVIEKYNNGEPTGILKDNAMNLVTSITPIPPEEDFYKAALTALNHACKFGITTVQDITLWKDFEIYQRLENEGRLSCRIYTRLPIADYKKLVDAGIKYNSGSDKLKTGSLKAFSDGSLGAGTAWFFDSYLDDSSNFGLPMDIVTNGNLERWAFDADRNKLQVSVHAIGDKANAYLLDLYEKIEHENPSWDRRFRIEHAQHIRKKDIERISRLNAIVSAQPFHLYDDGNWAETKIGKERIQKAYTFNSFLKNKVRLCFGSDWPVVSLNPMLGIYAAVTRQTSDGNNSNGWISKEKISVEDAIKCYTIYNAYASFEENIKGSIEPGKLADLVVLSEDILTIPPKNIKNVKVDMTIFDGKIKKPD